jgi:hypothetical protein
MTNLSQYRGWVSGMRLRLASITLALTIVFVLEVVAAQSAVGVVIRMQLLCFVNVPPS